MDSDIPIQIAETVQTAHIKRDPSPSHDINPSTAASKREPASVQTQHHDYLIDDGGIDEDDDEDEYAQSKTETDEESDYNVVKSRPRRNIHQLPPIPDLRYEQSYLHSIRNADRWWKVVLITARDQACFFFFLLATLKISMTTCQLTQTPFLNKQVMMPLVQGLLYNMLVCGWQSWNRNAQIHGSSIGARVRRWWYGVNNWEIPPAPGLSSPSVKR
ncbi:unnamed protein product [Sordaria macrospora k-hell]|uniref:WGS project CABT00000000 data, contig 2.13 n=1 Tax=Sordaria macrospora (strain ATCC MYA-333 / DSM 997 / K(L3346) / K-hell) TaxID=771870 RepID=F7VYP4_SORMK|nr:uncharacterized protein SMAC_08846 [Sordaria macrospora k-hell]CCC10639.1 unnamed protein product [Sordaria macrospora k-hell]